MRSDVKTKFFYIEVIQCIKTLSGKHGKRMFNTDAECEMVKSSARGQYRHENVSWQSRLSMVLWTKGIIQIWRKLTHVERRLGACRKYVKI